MKGAVCDMGCNGVDIIRHHAGLCPYPLDKSQSQHPTPAVREVDVSGEPCFWTPHLATEKTAVTEPRI